MVNVEKFIIKLFLVVIVSFIWTVILPGFIAYKDGVFYSAEVERKVENTDEAQVSQVTSFKDYKNKINNYKLIIISLDTKIKEESNKAEKSADLESLIKFREIYKKELSEIKKPISTAGFYNSGAVYCYLFSYIFLILAVFLFAPSIKNNKRNLIKIFLTATLLIIIWRFSGWLRSIEYFNAEQTMFSFIEYRFSFWGFWTQELRGYGICILISLLWQNWICYLSEQRFNDRTWKKELSIDNLLKYSNSITQMFNQWQYCFISITFAFLPWTYLYWKLIFLSSDNRYVFSAFSIHLFWLITWAVISLPLIFTFYFWTMYKNNFLADLVQRNEENISNLISFVREINPLSSFQIVGAALITIISFLIPFINLLFK